MASRFIEHNQGDTSGEHNKEDFTDARPEELYQNAEEERNLDYLPTPDNSPHLIKH